MTGQLFILKHREARRRAADGVETAPDGYYVRISAPTRTLPQNDKFHALCTDIAKSDLLWMGKRRTAAQWKVLLVSGHAVATQEGSELVLGLEGEFVNLRESTALMSIKRGASLITYTQAYGDMNGVVWTEKEIYDQRI